MARADSISVRYLHKLFQADSGTIGQWIRRCRLQKCRSELAGLDATRRSISAVAHRWGFTSASHFSRAFRSLYGISLADWRDPGVRRSPWQHQVRTLRSGPLAQPYRSRARSGSALTGNVTCADRDLDSDGRV
ncbi:helix-turn-helix transcriptional regulator [Streptomyces sp900105755]|uniref:helix-turn-helix transcriptional regulator n=1 Tax=Streptomyces sp. 900105755 TaxID=3154389 RepID=UPI0033176B59